MNAEHYAKVKCVLRKSEAKMRELRSANTPLKIALSQAHGFCTAFWKEEFPEGIERRPENYLDLSGADLSGGLFAMEDYPGNPLQCANFRNAQLPGSRWLLVAIKKADFTGADLSNCTTAGLRCAGASFRDTNLTGSSLDLEFKEGDQPADFTGANLRGAKITQKFGSGPLPVVLKNVRTTPFSILWWRRMFNSSFGKRRIDHSDNLSLLLSCEKCGQLYRLGEDAFAMTTSGTLGTFAHITILSGGDKSDNRDDPDLVETCDWKTLNRAEFYRKEIAKIRTAVDSGGPRWWQCRRCGQAQQYKEKQ